MEIGGWGEVLVGGQHPVLGSVKKTDHCVMFEGLDAGRAELPGKAALSLSSASPWEQVRRPIVSPPRSPSSTVALPVLLPEGKRPEASGEK